MIGSSWGGFNALQIAALRPPALAAIVTNCSTDDRYADDMHYMGGCLLNDMLDWGSSFFARLPRPPDPEISGPDWRRKWQERLDRLALPLAVWLQHQRRDAVLEARLGQRGLRRHPVPGLRHRRLDGRLLERDPAAARAPHGAAARAHRRLGAQVRPPGRPRVRRSGTCRSASGGGTTGSRARTPGSCASRCSAPSCRRRCRRRGDYPVCPGRWVAEPVWPPRAPKAPAAPSERGRCAPGPGGPRGDPHPPVGADDRRRRRRVVSPRDRWLRPAVPDRSARGRRPEPRVRDRAAAPPARDPGPAGGARWRSRWTSRWRSSPSGSTTSSPTAACRG